jgi:DnaJ-class molecular chaperone
VYIYSVRVYIRGPSTGAVFSGRGCYRPRQVLDCTEQKDTEEKDSSALDRFTDSNWERALPPCSLAKKGSDPFLDPFLSNMDKDHYRTLGVARGASQQEIKRAYRRLARRYHPDVSSEAGAEERFKEVGEAYEVLSDTEKRSAYDAMGRQWRTGRHFRSAPAGGVGGFGFGRARAEGGVRDFGDFFESLFRGSFHTDRDRPYRTRGEDVEVELTLTLEEAFSGVTKTLMLERPGTPSGIRLRSSRRVRVRVPPGVTDGQRLKLY